MVNLRCKCQEVY